MFIIFLGYIFNIFVFVFDSVQNIVMKTNIVYNKIEKFLCL